MVIKDQGFIYRLPLLTVETALIIRTEIKQDIAHPHYYDSLSRYKELIQIAALSKGKTTQDLFTQNIEWKNTPVPKTATKLEEAEKVEILKEFDLYLVVKDKVNDTNYYALTRKILVKCGVYILDDVPVLLCTEKWSAKTFNDWSNYLHAFFDWLKRKRRSQKIHSLIWQPRIENVFMKTANHIQIMKQC